MACERPLNLSSCQPIKVWSLGQDCVERTPHRKVLQGVDSWSKPAGAQSVTMVAVRITTAITILTIDGASPLFEGENVTWSIMKDSDDNLDGGVLSVTTGASDILVINWVA